MKSVKCLNISKLNKIFKKYPLYSQEDVKTPVVILELFIPNQNMYWLITEGNKENDDFIFFGYCKITYGELGYVSFNELSSLDFDIQFIHHKKLIKLDELKNKYGVVEVEDE